MLHEGDHNNFKEFLKNTFISEIHLDAVINSNGLKCVLNDKKANRVRNSNASERDH